MVSTYFKSAGSLSLLFSRNVTGFDTLIPHACSQRRFGGISLAKGVLAAEPLFLPILLAAYGFLPFPRLYARIYLFCSFCILFFKQGIHLGKPDNCPDFIYAIMKDCWKKEPEKRLEFTVIEMRLKNPYHNYDVPPPASDTEEGPEKREETQEGNEQSRGLISDYYNGGKHKILA